MQRSLEFEKDAPAQCSAEMRCHTCNDTVLHRIDETNLYALLLKSEASLLSAHVASPHASSHNLYLHYWLPADSVLQRVTFPLRIDCYHNSCKNNAQKRTFETECTPWLVSAAAIVFHAAHEGHPFRLRYGIGDMRVEIVSPTIDRQQIVQNDLAEAKLK
jgi:hypothetical protein